MPEAKQPIFEFPCTFPIKIIGNNSEGFVQTIITIVRKHVPTLSDEAVTSHPSSNGKYRALTATFTAESQKQLDALYTELTKDERVLMVL